MLLMRSALAAAMLLACNACSPTFDWRETRPDAALQVLFPCRPSTLARQVQLADRPESMQLTSCSAGDLTFGIGRVEARELERVPALMRAVLEATAANLATPGGALPYGPAAVANVPAHPNAGRFRMVGRAPDGKQLVAHAMLFTARGVVYQASVIGLRPEPEVVDMFFESIRIGSL
jgi:hypothetical protein